MASLQCTKPAEVITCHQEKNHGHQASQGLIHGHDHHEKAKTKTRCAGQTLTHGHHSGHEKAKGHCVGQAHGHHVEHHSKKDEKKMKDKKDEKKMKDKKEHKEKKSHEHKKEKSPHKKNKDGKSGHSSDSSSDSESDNDGCGKKKM